jgi:hypothetical protein
MSCFGRPGKQREEKVPRKKVKPQGDDPHDVGAQLRRVGNLLGLLATKDMGENDKVGTLSAAGFSNVEIARLLSKDENAVGVALFRYKTKTKRK